MLRWLATLSYQSIAARSSEFISNPDLVGKSQNDAPEPALQPKEAVFSVRLAIYNLIISKLLGTILTLFYYL